MLNRSTSACTAAQTSTKRSSLIRQATITAMLLLAAVFSSCEIKQRPKLIKPFIVTGIEYGSEQNETYYYQDANGIVQSFYTKRFSYRVGDTLK